MEWWKPADEDIIERAKELLLGKQDCPNCGGTGMVWTTTRTDAQSQCETCRGTGQIDVR